MVIQKKCKIVMEWPIYRQQKATKIDAHRMKRVHGWMRGDFSGLIGKSWVWKKNWNDENTHFV